MTVVDTELAYTDLQNTGTTIAAADGLLANFKYENAVQGYQAAASSGLNIAAQLAADTPSIHDAIAAANGVLALNWSLASQQTAQQAQAGAKQMLSLLQQQYNATPQSIVVAPTVTPTAPGTSKPIDPMWIALGGLALVGVGGFAWWYFSKRPRENPSGGRSVGARRGKTLIAKGSRTTRFEMIDGPDVTVTGAMLHDPSGRWWPKNSVLFGRLKRLRRATDEEFTGPAKDYLGGSHNAQLNEIDTPTKGLNGWRYIGDVERIFYTRTGRKRPGYYQHEFNKSTALATLVKGKGRVRLYRLGRFVRLELPRGAMLDARGYIWP
jgi:hypothetical protein